MAQGNGSIGLTPASAVVKACDELLLAARKDIEHIASYGKGGTLEKTPLQRLNTNVQDKLAGLRAQMRSLEVMVEEQDSDEESAALHRELERVKEEVNKLRLSLRSAHAQAKQTAEKAAQRERELLLGGGEEAVLRRRKLQTQAEMTAAAEDVTDSLRRTRQMMAQEVERGVATLQVMGESNTTLRKSDKEYAGQGSLLGTTRRLLSSLQKQDVQDRLIIIVGSLLFLTVCLYVFWKRMPLLNKISPLSWVIRRRAPVLPAGKPSSDLFPPGGPIQPPLRPGEKMPQSIAPVQPKKRGPSVWGRLVNVTSTLAKTVANFASRRKVTESADDEFWKVLEGLEQEDMKEGLPLDKARSTPLSEEKDNDQMQREGLEVGGKAWAGPEESRTHQGIDPDGTAFIQSRNASEEVSVGGNEAESGRPNPAVPSENADAVPADGVETSGEGEGDDAGLMGGGGGVEEPKLAPPTEGHDAVSEAGVARQQGFHEEDMSLPPMEVLSDKFSAKFSAQGIPPHPDPPSTEATKSDLSPLEVTASGPDFESSSPQATPPRLRGFPEPPSPFRAPPVQPPFPRSPETAAEADGILAHIPSDPLSRGGLSEDDEVSASGPDTLDVALDDPPNFLPLDSQTSEAESEGSKLGSNGGASSMVDDSLGVNEVELGADLAKNLAPGHDEAPSVETASSELGSSRHSEDASHGEDVASQEEEGTQGSDSGSEFLKGESSQGTAPGPETTASHDEAANSKHTEL